MRGLRWPRCNIKSLDTRRVFSISHAQLERVNVAQLLATKSGAEHVDIYGWVRSVRRQKKVAFAALGDGSTKWPIQAVLKPEDTASLTTGAAARLSGSWRASQGKEQSHELEVTQVEVLGENDAEHNPLQPKHQTPEFLRTVPHLRPRIPANALLLRLRSDVIASLTKFFGQEGFVQTHTPVITSSDCEGAGEVFTVSSNDTSRDSKHERQSEKEPRVEHFFRTPKYLTVSAQLHLEALAQAVDKVWTLSPTFRAEKSDTPRHLSEFYMLEAELCFINDVNAVMDLVERMLQAIAKDLLASTAASELLDNRQAISPGETENGLESANTLTQRWQGLERGGWRRIPYANAIEFLQAAQSQGVKFDDEPIHANGLAAEHERYLAKNLDRPVTGANEQSELGEGNPVFITDYPRAQKAFYMSPSLPTSNSSGMDNTAACFDLLVPGLCELVGGSMREHRFQELQQAMKAKGVAGETLEWYSDLRKYGSVPHGGFGLGFDRLMCYLTGVANVRDVVAFPRWHGRCDY